jgi:predicted O-methyltransferase YrrM
MEFTNDWFGATGRYIWDKILPQLGPKRILEIGSYEGRSACFLIEKLSGPLEIHCVDTWEGGAEHKRIDMSFVKRRFDSNTQATIANSKNEVNLKTHVGSSDTILSQMQVEYKDYFDFIYIDGSHVAADVLCDAVLAFRLLRSGGVMCFDDYLWRDEAADPINCPKVAIDAFTLIYCKHLEVMALPPTQLFVEKL